MSFIVYILYSDSSEKYYTGHTQNLVNRIKEHNSGETASLRSGIPWRLIWSFQCASRSEAMKLESKIKKRGAKRFIESLSRGA